MSGSETRQRSKILKARFTPEEAALIEEQAARAGVSVASVIRYATLGQTPLRASRTPSANVQEIARLIAVLGPLKSALIAAEKQSGARGQERLIEAACRDIADICGSCREALGLEP